MVTNIEFAIKFHPKSDKICDQSNKTGGVMSLLSKYYPFVKKLSVSMLTVLRAKRFS
jgi:hypothetical protein